MPGVLRLCSANEDLFYPKRSAQMREVFERARARVCSTQLVYTNSKIMDLMGENVRKNRKSDESEKERERESWFTWFDHECAHMHTHYFRTEIFGASLKFIHHFGVHFGKSLREVPGTHTTI